MWFQSSLKKILEKRGYHHCDNDDEFTRHGDYVSNIQYAFSREFIGLDEKIVDVILLGADFRSEKLVIGFFRENISIENGVLENSTVGIPLVAFSLEEFEKQLDHLIPRGSPLKQRAGHHSKF